MQVYEVFVSLTIIQIHRLKSQRNAGDNLVLQFMYKLCTDEQSGGKLTVFTIKLIITGSCHCFVCEHTLETQG